MMMLFLFLSLFASQLLFVTPCVIDKEQIENNEEAPSLNVNKSISVSPEPETTEAPWSNVQFPFHKDQHYADNCRKVGLYVDFVKIGLDDHIISPGGFNAFRCEGKCFSTQRKKFPNRSAIMALLEKKKGINDVACCVPTKLAPITALVFHKNGSIALRKFDDMVVEECGCE